MGRSNAHYSLVWLQQNFDGVMARLARLGITTFTLTHRGRDVGQVDLDTAQPAGAVSQLPLAPPVLGDDELDELDSETRESIQAFQARATAP